MYDWGDLKYFLAAARSGSTLAAARELRVNQTTVARRIAALETSLNVRLFDRNKDGYRLSEEGAAILAQAERVAAEAESLHSIVGQRRRNISGVIRVTTPEALANLALTPWISEFIDLYPDIRVEVIAVDRRIDLLRGEADIALRAGPPPTEPGLVVRKVGDCYWALYCSRSYAEKRGVPGCAQDLNDHLVVGADGWLAQLGPNVWLANMAPRATVRSVSSTVINMVYAIKAGQGIGPLPSSMAALEPDLVECFVLSDLKYIYYLAMPEALKDVPRIRAFSDFIAGRAAAQRHVLEGRPRKR